MSSFNEDKVAMLFVPVLQIEEAPTGGFLPVPPTHLQGEVKINGEAGVVYIGEQNLLQWVKVIDVKTGVRYEGEPPVWIITDQNGAYVADGTFEIDDDVEGYSSSIMESQSRDFEEHHLYRLTMVVDGVAKRKFNFLPRHHSETP